MKTILSMLCGALAVDLQQFITYGGYGSPIGLYGGYGGYTGFGGLVGGLGTYPVLGGYSSGLIFAQTGEERPIMEQGSGSRIDVRSGLGRRSRMGYG